MQKVSVVQSDPDILSGTPVFIGTRVPFMAYMDYVDSGASFEEFLENFPAVTREQVIAAIRESGVWWVTMRFLLDECLPKGSKPHLAGHEVFTFKDMTWNGDFSYIFLACMHVFNVGLDFLSLCMDGAMRRVMFISVCLAAFLGGICLAQPILRPFSCDGTAWCSGTLGSGYVPGPPDIFVSDCISTGGSWDICIQSSGFCKVNGGLYSPCVGFSATLGAVCVEDHYNCINWN